MDQEVKKINDLVLEIAKKAREETENIPEPERTQPLEWPIQTTIGPGLEGAIACESKVGYVNGTKGWLVYRGHDIFDLCAHSTFEEVSYLLLHGDLPNSKELKAFKNKLAKYSVLNQTLRMLMSSPVEDMNPMAGLRLGTLVMRRRYSRRDEDKYRPTTEDAISADEDSIPMETAPRGEIHAIYEFKKRTEELKAQRKHLEDASGIDACYHLIAGVSTITAAVGRIHQGYLPVEPDPKLSHAANFLYMITGRKPTPVEERVMDIALILHADHGMNASTFASMVVASTLSDIYFSVGAGIGALNGPLHGGANEEVIKTLNEIGAPEKVKPWLDKTLSKKGKVSGFGHRVYKAYDPRARVLGGIANAFVRDNKATKHLFSTAQELEKEVVSRLGAQKKIFPNVDFFSGMVYLSLGIAPEMFTPIFAVSRVAGWTARVLEYLDNNRIFRPRAMYTGEFHKEYVPIEKRN
jgi:citrate synthase